MECDLDKIEELLPAILEIQAAIRNQVLTECQENSYEKLSEVAFETASDTIYAIDQSIEELVLNLFHSKIAERIPIVLIAEGIGDGKIVLPKEKDEKDALWRIIVDPIDGTRELMYQKRSAWILTGVAPNKGKDTNLQDILLAVQTEIPLLKQHEGDVLWAIKGKGAAGQRYNRLTGEIRKISLQPSKAETIAHGFAMISRFFPGGSEIIADIEEELIQSVLGKQESAKPLCFFDQYLSTGGQIYELVSGHDRFNADLRPLIAKLLTSENQEMPFCCHPYDICTELIARESGVIITDEYGKPLSAKLNVSDDVAWVGYANEIIKSLIEPHLQRILKSRGLL